MWVQAVRYDLFSSAVFLPYFSMLILSPPLLGLGSKSTSLRPGVCLCGPKQYDTIWLELNLISGLFAFFWLIVWEDAINLWVVPCGRQVMLTQGRTPNPKCKLNISSLLTLPHVLGCLICTGNSVSIVLLLWMMGGWDRWGVGWFKSGCGWADRGQVLSNSFCFS